MLSYDDDATCLKSCVVAEIRVDSHFVDIVPGKIKSAFFFQAARAMPQIPKHSIGARPMCPAMNLPQYSEVIFSVPPMNERQ